MMGESLRVLLRRLAHILHMQKGIVGGSTNPVADYGGAIRRSLTDNAQWGDRFLFSLPSYMLCACVLSMCIDT